MFSHVTLGTQDLNRARQFYEPVMATLGLSSPFALPGTLIFGALIGPKIFILSPFDGQAASVGNGSHVALAPPDRAAVDAFHSAALAHSGSDEGAPGLGPQYHPHYYAAYVSDPDGNKVQAVCHDGMDD